MKLRASALCLLYLILFTLPLCAFAAEDGSGDLILDNTQSTSRSIPLPRPSAGSGVLSDRIVAWVNDEPLTLTELEEAFIRYQSNGELPSAPETEASLRQALENWIDETLILMAAKRANIEAPEAPINNRVEAMIKQAEKQQGGAEALEALLEKAGQNRDRFREKLRGQLQREWTVIRAVNAHFTISEADVAQFERERHAEGLPTEKYRLFQLFFPLDGNASQEHVNQVTDLAHQARLQMQQQGDFAELAPAWARRHAEAGVEADDLGTVSADQLVPELAAAVASAKEGESTAPTRTKKGIHVLYLEHKTTARQILFARRFEAERAKWVKELRNGATIQISEPILGKE